MFPLNEVIVNLFRPLKIRHNEQGRISIKVIRGKQISLEGDFDAPYLPIEGFEVYDNGIGFINEISSFQ